MSYADFILDKVSRLEEHIKEVNYRFDKYDLSDVLNPQPRMLVPAPGNYTPPPKHPRSKTTTNHSPLTPQGDHHGPSSHPRQAHR